MKTKSLVLALAILILVAQPALILARSVNAEEQAQTAVRILPAENEKLVIGESFSLNVSIENCIDVYAVQVDVHYDPTVLRVVSISPASISVFPLLVKKDSNVFDELLNLTYNGPTYGQIYYVTARGGDATGVDGDCFLFTITFKVISDGSSSIQLIQYPGGGSATGTYFMNPQPSPTTGFGEIIPNLYSANYGPPVTTPPSSTPNPYDTGQVQTAILLPFLLPVAALLLVAIKRKTARKTPN
jgi:hypothetical protein